MKSSPTQFLFGPITIATILAAAVQLASPFGWHRVGDTPALPFPHQPDTLNLSRETYKLLRLRPAHARFNDGSS